MSLCNEACNETAVFHGVRILVVDNNSDARDLLTVVFEQQGAEVLTAACVAEAIDLVERLKPNVLLSEIAMPEEDGYLLMHRVKALAEQQLSPILAIATTICARPEDRLRTISEGFRAHLSKPIDLDELVAVVRDLVSQERRGSVALTNG